MTVPRERHSPGVAVGAGTRSAGLIATLARLAGQVWHALPKGQRLPQATWRSRHRGIVILLALHVPAVVVFALAMGNGLAHSLAEGLPITLAACVAYSGRCSRRVRSVTASLGLFAASAVLVHLSGGYIEFHFHYFVMVPIVALYQDWVPFLIAIGFVAVQHGAVGALDPMSVYNHAAALANPWGWAGIHATFIVGQSIASVVTWRIAEGARQREEQAAREAEAQAADLAASQGRLRTLYAALACGVLVQDTSGHATHMNAAAEDIFGLTLDEIRGPVGELLRPATEQSGSAGAGAEDPTSVAIRTGRPVRKFTQRMTRPDGEVRWIQTDAVPVLGPDGRPIEIVSSFIDVTERKRAEDEIKTLNDELERRVTERTSELTAANEELGAFSYSVSHDLRSPLRSIDGFSQALQDDYGDQLDDTAKGYLERVRANSQRMGQLISDMLVLSRVTRDEMRRGSVDLSAIARSVATQLQEADPDRQATFQIADGVTATGDADLLHIVLQNLLGNAWKFTSKRPHATIAFEVSRDNGTPAYVVKDNGAGFDMAYADKLFGAFQRLHRETQFEGTGIGLATVKRILQRHGGRIWAEARVDDGATFSFTLEAERHPQ